MKLYEISEAAYNFHDERGGFMGDVTEGFEGGVEFILELSIEQIKQLQTEWHNTKKSK